MEAQAAVPAGVEEERALMQPDDLASLWWLGPKSAMLLNAAGVLIFEQLAAMTSAQIKAILGEAGLLVRHVDSWPEQARLAAAGQWKELDVYQRRLGKKAR
jgi:predicted flap endonuclease-1-like 5' DNA nuclease